VLRRADEVSQLLTREKVDAPSGPVVAGTRVRDRLCGQVHTLRPPVQTASDALLVYNCSVRDLNAQGPVLQATHVGAILGRLVGGLTRTEEPASE
jgi:hypothetical protein